MQMLEPIRAGERSENIVKGSLLWGSYAHFCWSVQRLKFPVKLLECVPRSGHKPEKQILCCPCKKFSLLTCIWLGDTWLFSYHSSALPEKQISADSSEKQNGFKHCPESSSELIGKMRMNLLCVMISLSGLPCHVLWDVQPMGAVVLWRYSSHSQLFMDYNHSAGKELLGPLWFQDNMLCLEWGQKCLLCFW